MALNVQGHDARSVADRVIEQGIGMPNGPYTPLQVIKLTYLCHGWMLGLYGRPLCWQPVEAWKHGPVIADVYHEVKIFGKKQIKKAFGFTVADFDEYEKHLIDQVLDAYSEFSGIDLSIRTHRAGSPWSMVYRPGKNVVIPNNIIEKYFAELAEV